MVEENSLHQEDLGNPFQRRYKAPYPYTHETELLLQPHLHLSNKRLLDRNMGIVDVKRRGAPTKVMEWWNVLTPWQQCIVYNAGLSDLVQLYQFRNFDKVMMNAFAERWSDTTNTFHLPLGDVHLINLFRNINAPSTNCPSLHKLINQRKYQNNVLELGVAGCSMLYENIHMCTILE